MPGAPYNGAGAGAGVPDRPQSHCGHRLLRRRPSGRASATQFVPGNPDAEDPIERVSSRPDYLVLGYAWIGAFTIRTGYCERYKTMDGCAALRAEYSPDLFVSKDTPPTFSITPSMTRRFRWSRDCAFTRHWSRPAFPPRRTSFANGPHGSGLGKGDPALDQWPNLLETWLRAQGLLTPDKSVAGTKPAEMQRVSLGGMQGHKGSSQF